jgi:hypothetical protein
MAATSDDLASTVASFGVRPKTGAGAASEARRDERRREIRTWTRDDVTRHLTAEGTLRDLTIFVHIDVIKAETGSESVLPSFGAGQRRRVPLITALHYQRIDGNALLDMSQADLMRVVGIQQLGMAKAVLRVVAALSDPQHLLPEIQFIPVQSQLAGAGSSAACHVVTSSVSKDHPPAAAVRYASLDPFSGWESQMHQVTADPTLRDKAKSKFSLGKMFGKSVADINTDDLDTQRAISAAKDEIDIMLAREQNEALLRASEHAREELAVATVEDALSDGLDPCGAPPPCETVIRMSATYSAGILEAERRLSEIRANYRSLASVVGDQLTVPLVVKSAARCWGWASDQEQSAIRGAADAVGRARAARGAKRAKAITNPSHRLPCSRSEADSIPVNDSVRLAGQRPASATSRQLAALGTDAAPLDSPLTRNDFICAVSYLTEHQEPAEFDRLLCVLSSEFGRDRIELVRRQQTAQELFRKLDVACCGALPLSTMAAMVSAYCTDHGIVNMTANTGAAAPLALTARRRRSSAARPASAPLHRSLSSSVASPTRDAMPPAAVLLPPAGRPSSATSARNDADEATVDEATFSDFIVDELCEMKGDQFDNAIMSLRVIAEKLTANERPFQTITQTSFEDAVVQGTTVTPRNMVIILSSSADPAVFVQTMFATGQKTLRTAAALHRQVADPALICAPPVRQPKLHVCCVDGDLGMRKTLELISSAGLERGNWILVDCPPTTMDPVPQHVAPPAKQAGSPYDVDYLQIALDEAEEIIAANEREKKRRQSSSQPVSAGLDGLSEVRNGLMNTFLRSAARLILSKSSLSIHRSFRLFVRCPVDSLDDNNVPQIARSISAIVPLRVSV